MIHITSHMLLAKASHMVCIATQTSESQCKEENKILGTN